MINELNREFINRVYNAVPVCEFTDDNGQKLVALIDENNDMFDVTARLYDDVYAFFFMQQFYAA